MHSANSDLRQLPNIEAKAKANFLKVMEKIQMKEEYHQKTEEKP
jgi:hypothetical protein